MTDLSTHWKTSYADVGRLEKRPDDPRGEGLGLPVGHDPVARNVLTFGSPPVLRCMSDLLDSPTFSSYWVHEPVRFVIPACFNAAALMKSGRSARVTFEFAMQGILLCWSALRKNYEAFDVVRDGGVEESQALARSIFRLDRRDEFFEECICPIARIVATAKMKAVRKFRAALLATGSKAILADTSRSDEGGDESIVWGVGNVRSHEIAAQNPESWTGFNVSGWALMQAREKGMKLVRESMNGVTPSVWRKRKRSPSSLSAAAAKAKCLRGECTCDPPLLCEAAANSREGRREEYELRSAKKSRKMPDCPARKNPHSYRLSTVGGTDSGSDKAVTFEPSL